MKKEWYSNKNISEAEVIVRGTPEDYFNYCNLVGIEPADQDRYLLGQADRLYQHNFLRGLESKIKKEYRKGKTGISVIINNSEAKEILMNYNETSNYLKDIIERYVSDQKRPPIDEMDFRSLIHYGRVIRGVADKIVKSENKIR